MGGVDNRISLVFPSLSSSQRNLNTGAKMKFGQHNGVFKMGLSEKMPLSLSSLQRLKETRIIPHIDGTTHEAFPPFVAY